MQRIAKRYHVRMPAYVFSYHTKLSWMPDDPRGYVKRHKGILPSDPNEAERYRRHAVHSAFTLTDELQRAVIEEVLVASKQQELRSHFVATEPTHIHILASWRSDKTWQAVRNGLKSSLTKLLRRVHGAEAADRQFFSNGSSRKHVRNQRHFDHWMTEYGPKHSGWKWCEGKGLFK